MSQLIPNSKITIETEQITNLEKSSNKVCIPAFLKQEGGKTIIHYRLCFDDNSSETSETMTVISKEEIKLIRHGFINTRMLFKKGEITPCNYKTTIGEIPIFIETNDIKLSYGDNGIKIMIDYSISQSENERIEDRIYTKLTVTVCK